jgi:hypothetical protein
MLESKGRQWRLPSRYHLKKSPQYFQVWNLNSIMMMYWWHIMMMYFQQIHASTWKSCSNTHKSSWRVTIHCVFFAMVLSDDIHQLFIVLMISNKNDSIMVTNIDIWTIFLQRNLILLPIMKQNLLYLVARTVENVDIEGLFFNIE